MHKQPHNYLEYTDVIKISENEKKANIDLIDSTA